MKLRRMSIRNVKAIPALDISFDDRVTLLHGANGIGKSTILDCAALLGHLPAMRRLYTSETEAALQPPVLVKMLRRRTDLEAEILDRLDDVVQYVPSRWTAIHRDLTKYASVEQWFDDDYIRVPRIRYEVEIPNLDDFGVVSLIVAMIGPDEITVSHILNRSRCDDFQMADNAVVFAASNAALDRWLEGQASASTSLVKTISGQFRAIRPIEGAALVGNRVVAINTDLADLGKRDQVRESVKDLHLHFVEEVDRLNLPFDADVAPGRKRFRFFEDLSAILSRVVTDPSATRSVPDEPFLRLTTCDVEDGVARVSFKRANEQRSFSADFLSAGENECFFIFLTLLGIDTQNSIVVLDEPELHIAEYCRPAFFAELYGLTDKRRCQVIIATHSLFAMPESGSVQFLVIGRMVERGGRVRYECGPNPEYSLLLFRAYWRTGVLFLSTAGAARPLRALASAVYGALARLSGDNTLAVGILVGVISSATVSLASDLVNFFGLQSVAEHLVIIRAAVLSGVIVGAVTSLVLIARRKIGSRSM